MVLDVISYQKARKHGHRHSADRTDAIPKRGLARSQLECPLEDVSFSYLSGIGRCKAVYVRSQIAFGILFDNMFQDKAVETYGNALVSSSLGRVFADETFYFYNFDYDMSTQDVMLRKDYEGNITILGYEAIDIETWDAFLTKLSCSSSNICLYRTDMTSPKISCTDTDIAEGYFGYSSYAPYYFSYDPCTTFLRAPSSSSPSILGYFSVPISGSGTEEDPFKIVMPEEISEHHVWGNINKLSLSNSALIKTNKNGKPLDGEAIVKIIKQNERQDYLRAEAESLSELRKMKGVIELSREEAIREAKRKDDKLHDLDLKDERELKMNHSTAKKEYITWREKTMGVRRENIDDRAMERYVQEKKW